MADAGAEPVELDADLANVRVARREVRERLTDVPDSVVGDLQLIVSELVTNAVEHGPGGPITIEVRRTREAVDLIVRSPAPQGALRSIDEWAIPTAGSMSGRGLGIVRSLADDVEVGCDGELLSISVHRRI